MIVSHGVGSFKISLLFVINYVTLVKLFWIALKMNLNLFYLRKYKMKVTVSNDVNFIELLRY